MADWFPAPSFGSLDLGETLDAVVLANVEFVVAAGVHIAHLKMQRRDISELSAMVFVDDPDLWDGDFDQ